MDKRKLLSGKFAFILISICLYVFYGYTQSEGSIWKYMGVNEDGTFYYDTESIYYPSKGIGRVWVQFFVTRESKDNLVRRLKESGFYNKAKKLGNLEFIKILYEIDCSNQLVRNMEKWYYDKRGNTLEVINSPGKREKLIISDKPRTPLESIFKAVCP